MEKLDPSKEEITGGGGKSSDEIEKLPDGSKLLESHEKILKYSPFLTRTTSSSYIEPLLDPPIMYIRRPNSRIIPQLSKPGGVMEVNPNAPVMAKDPPEATIFRDKNNGVCGLRCTCELTHTDVLLVRCSECGYYLHGTCVGIAQVNQSTKYVCPYCAWKGLRCKCYKNMKYDEPIIQCYICGYWSHKSCYKLGFGRNPQKFICNYCGPIKYPPPIFRFPKHPRTVNFTRDVPKDGLEHLRKIPEGDFHDLIFSLLEKPQLDFIPTVELLLSKYGVNLFEYGHEFWKTFVGTISDIFDIPKLHVMDALDEAASHFLYHKSKVLKMASKERPVNTLRIAQSIAHNVATANLPKVPTLSPPVRLFENNGAVFASSDIEDGQYICDVPGLLCHQDEIRAEAGIPTTCLTVPDTPLAVDVSQSSNNLISKIRRSFHFNCIVRLQLVDGRPRVLLYAARTRGPLADERGSSGPTIRKDGELFLPFDADLPYTVEKAQWKVKKAKPPAKQKSRAKGRTKTHQKTAETTASNSNETAPKMPSPPREKHKPRVKIEKKEPREKKERKPRDDSVKLTLLSSFIEDDCPPLPFVIQSSSDDDARSIARSRHKNHVMRVSSEEKL